jgi:hypothetical protein
MGASRRACCSCHLLGTPHLRNAHILCLALLNVVALATAILVLRRRPPVDAVPSSSTDLDLFNTLVRVCLAPPRAIAGLDATTTDLAFGPWNLSCCSKATVTASAAAASFLATSFLLPLTDIVRSSTYSVVAPSVV